jgi:hypothetical protein
MEEDGRVTKKRKLFQVKIADLAKSREFYLDKFK